MGADGQVKSLIDRVLRLKEEQDALAADIREVYAEAKGNGYDKTALGEVVAYLRKIEKKGKDAVEERGAIFDLYLSAYERPSHTHAREGLSYAEVKGGGEDYRDEITPEQMDELRRTVEPTLSAEEWETVSGPAWELTDTQEQPETANQSATNEGESDAKSADHPACEKHDLIDRRRQDENHEQGRSESKQVRSGRNIAGVAAPRVGTSTETPAESVEISASNSPSAARTVEPEADTPSHLPASGEVSDADVPAFLLKDRKPLRPNCLNPGSNCAGYGDHTCHACKRAAAESEAA